MLWVGYEGVYKTPFEYRETNIKTIRKMRIKIQDKEGNRLCEFKVGGFLGDRNGGGKQFKLADFRGCSLYEIQRDHIGTFVFIQVEQDFTNQLKQVEDGNSE